MSEQCAGCPSTEEECPTMTPDSVTDPGGILDPFLHDQGHKKTDGTEAGGGITSGGEVTHSLWATG